MTLIAHLMPGNLYFGFRAKDRVHKFNSEIVMEVCASARPGLLSTPSAEPEELLKYVAETRKYVAEIPESGKAGLLKPGMAELIIQAALLHIAEYFVRLSRLFEPLLSLFVTRISIRVVLQGEFSIGLFDLVVGCRLGHTKDLVIIAFGHYEET